MHFEHSHERRPVAVTATALFVAPRADGDEIALGEQPARFFETHFTHGFQP
jgi:hypothetical protein